MEYECLVADYTQRLARLTVWLVGVTLLLGFATFVAAIAAKEAANHIPKVERAYVSGGAQHPFLKMVRNKPTFDKTRMVVTINNYGKTPAFIGTVEIGICDEGQLKNRPAACTVGYAGFMLKPDTSGYPSNIGVRWEANKAVFGKIWFRDIFNHCHSMGFVLRTNDSTAVAGHDEYWKECPENDLGPGNKKTA